MSNKAKETTMKPDGKPALTPKLRFPEFRDAVAWEEKKLGDVADVLMCKRIFANETNPTSGIPFYKIGTLGGTPDAFISRELFEAYKSKYNFPRAGEILITCSGTVGKCLPYDGIEAYYQDSNIVWIDNPTLEVRNEFLLSILSGVNWGTLNSTTITRIYGPDLRGLTIKFPQAQAEQQRIANCLTSLGDLISAQSAKLEALKTHKKGLMQQLFPREGETQPRLRFPEFQDAREWKEIELGQLINIKGRIGYRGYTVEDIVSPGDGAISLSPSNIDASGSLSFGKSTYISWEKYHQSPEIMVETGFTILVKTGSTYGKAAFVKELPQECTVNPQIVVLKPTSIEPYFLFLMIVGDIIQSRIEATVVGGAIPTLSQESVSKFKVHVPNAPEQQRIADCLTTLDDLIAAQTQKLEALKTHKKGLMQQLFPSPAEVEA